MNYRLFQHPPKKIKPSGITREVPGSDCQPTIERVKKQAFNLNRKGVTSDNFAQVGEVSK